MGFFDKPEPREDGFCPGSYEFLPRPHKVEVPDFAQGPNEEVAVCDKCWAPIAAFRPEGETFGLHWDDCSLPIRHAGECEHGGAGHPQAAKVRGC